MPAFPHVIAVLPLPALVPTYYLSQQLQTSSPNNFFMTDAEDLPPFSTFLFFASLVIYAHKHPSTVPSTKVHVSLIRCQDSSRGHLHYFLAIRWPATKPQHTWTPPLPQLNPPARIPDDSISSRRELIIYGPGFEHEPNPSPWPDELECNPRLRTSRLLPQPHPARPQSPPQPRFLRGPRALAPARFLNSTTLLSLHPPRGAQRYRISLRQVLPCQSSPYVETSVLPT